MRAWLRQHRRALGAAARKLAAQRSGALLGALAIGIALALPAGGYALLANLRALAGGAQLEPRLTLYLRMEAPRAEAEALRARLSADPRVREARLVTREQALAELAGTEGLAQVVAALKRNPLPDAVALRARQADPALLERLARELRTLPIVQYVQADAAWARRLAAIAGIARFGVALLAALLAFGLVAVTFSTIRLQILTQRAEIEVSRLVGATDAFIRRPFYYLGLLQGLAGGLVALALLWGGLQGLNLQVAELAESYGSGFRLAFLAPGDALAVVAFAAFLGWLGAFMSVSRHLRDI